MTMRKTVLQLRPVEVEQGGGFSGRAYWRSPPGRRSELPRSSGAEPLRSPGAEPLRLRLPPTLRRRRRLGCAEAVRAPQRRGPCLQLKKQTLLNGESPSNRASKTSIWPLHCIHVTVAFINYSLVSRHDLQIAPGNYSGGIQHVGVFLDSISKYLPSGFNFSTA